MCGVFKELKGTSLVVLRLQAFTIGGMGSIPKGTKIPHAVQCGQKFLKIN